MADPQTPKDAEGVAVRIAVLTFRRPDDIAAALPRLVEQARAVTDDRTTADIVVVDNASSDDSVAMVRRQYPDVGIIALPTNQGFSAAINAGAARASGDAVRNTFSSASGNTTVPMSRPSSTLRPL